MYIYRVAHKKGFDFVAHKKEFDATFKVGKNRFFMLAALCFKKLKIELGNDLSYRVIFFWHSIIG